MVKLLIAYDGSACSDAALKDLKRAGMPQKAEAVVFSVADTFLNGNEAEGLQLASLSAENNSVREAVSEAESIVREAKSSAAKAALVLKEYFPYWDIRKESVSNSPASAIIDKIQSWKPDLVVMGSHGRSAAGRLLFGSVSQKVLSHVHCNLRISRARAKEESISAPLRIVVAFDGSEESEIAFNAALHRDWPEGTAIRLIAVVETNLSMAAVYRTALIHYWMRGEDKDPLAWVERMLSDQKKRIEEKGFIAYAEAFKGDPKRVLLKQAEEWGADCIFAGPRGLTGKQRIIAGSVSTALAVNAHCSVEVIHRPWNAVNCCDKARLEYRDCMMNGEDWCY